MKPWVGDYLGYLTGSDNYRKEIAVTAPYKGNRSQSKPQHYDLIREYLEKAWGCEVVQGQEADDAIGIKAYEFEDVEDYVIMSIDKDLDMIRGWHYNFVKDKKYLIEDQDAIKHFYTQILTGDRVDSKGGAIITGVFGNDDSIVFSNYLYQGNIGQRMVLTFCLVLVYLWFITALLVL